MRLTEVLNQWLKEQEWEEQPEIDEENQTSSTSFGYSVGDFNLNCWFDINEKHEIFKLFVYFGDTKVPESRLEEVQKFVSAVSIIKLLLGNLQLLPEKRIIRYYNSIDVEGAAFEPQHITNMLSAGVGCMTTCLPKFMSICFGGKTTDEVLTEE
jgi:hypothetical protein